MKLFGSEVTKEKVKKFTICVVGAIFMTWLTFWGVSQLMNVGDLLADISSVIRINVISKP